MRKLVALGALVLLSFTAAEARAITIDVTLAPRDVSTLGEVTFIIGVQDDAGGTVDINGYTLGFEILDAPALSFVSAAQLASFGSGGVLPFDTTNDCTDGRCTAGNVPSSAFNALGVGDLFSLTFNYNVERDAGALLLRVGILNTVFEGITQAAGVTDPFTNGAVIQTVHAIPEPSTGMLLALGFGGLAVAGRRPRRIR